MAKRMEPIEELVKELEPLLVLPAAREVVKWMPLYIPDYLADLRHLSTLEHGAYLLLLLHGWRNGGKLELDDGQLARIAGLPLDQWKKIKPTIEKLFVVFDGTIWRQKRQVAELIDSIGKKSGRTTKAVTAAEARWEKERLEKERLAKACSSNAQALLDRCPSPSPSPLNLSTDSNNPPPPDVPTAGKKRLIVEFPIPPPLDTPAFRKAWATYQQYRRESKLKMYTPTGAATQLKRLTEWGEQRAIRAIEVSIANAWQGIYEDKANGNGRNGTQEAGGKQGPNGTRAEKDWGACGQVGPLPILDA